MMSVLLLRRLRIEPYKYLRYVFEKLLAADTIDELKALLPRNAKRSMVEVDDLSAVH
jgi:hypothetical protein